MLARFPTRRTVSGASTEWQGILLVLIGAVCFSSAILFVRLIDDMPLASIIFFRAFFGFVFLALMLPRFPAPLHVRQYQDAIPRLILLGIVMCMTISLYTYAIQHTTAAVAALLVNSAPIYVALLAPLLLGEHGTRTTWISIPLAVFGMVLVSNPSDLTLSWDGLDGIIAAALSGVTYAASMMLSRGLRGKVTGLTQTMWGLGITSLVLLPFTIGTPTDAVVDNLIYLVPLGIFSLGLSYLTYFLGLERVTTQVVSIVALFEPVSGILIGMLAFAEYPNLIGWIGGVLILGSIVLISR